MVCKIIQQTSPGRTPPWSCSILGIRRLMFAFTVRWSDQNNIFPLGTSKFRYKTNLYIQYWSCMDFWWFLYHCKSHITDHRKFTNIDCGKGNIGEIPGRWTKMWFLPIWVKFSRISITPGLFSGSQFGTPKSYNESFNLPTPNYSCLSSEARVDQTFHNWHPVLPTSSAIDPVFFDLRAMGELWWATLFSTVSTSNRGRLSSANFLAQCSSALKQRDQDHCQSLRIFHSVFFLGLSSGSIKHCLLENPSFDTGTWWFCDSMGYSPFWSFHSLLEKMIEIHHFDR